MALEQDTGQDRPSAAMRGGDPPPESPFPVPSIVASLGDVPSLPGGSYGDIQVAGGDTSTGDAPTDSLTLPFIPPGMSQDKLDKLRDTDVRILEDEMGARAAEQRRLDRLDKEFEARMEQANRAVGFEGSHLQPWNAEREMASRKHDLWEQFGSPAFLVTMMASAFTTMPMVSALNGGAAAMNAINQGDIEGYDKAFDAWRENTRLALDRMKMEQEQFNNLDHLRQSNMARWKEELSLKMAGFGDRRKLAMLEAGFDEDVIKAYEGLEKLQGQLESNFQAHVENKALFDGVQKELKNNPKGGWFEAYANTVKKLTAAKHPGAISSEERERHNKVLEDIASRKISVDEARQLETARHNAALESINQDKLITQAEKDRARQEEIDRHNRFMEDIVAKKTAETSRHNQRMEDVQSGKLTVEQARQEETSDHNRRMEAIAADKQLATQDRDKARQEEVDRHNRANEELTKARIEKSGGKAAMEASDKADIREDVVKAHPDWSKGEITKEVDKQYAAVTAKRSGTPEADIMNKFWEENPKATAAQGQAFRALAKSGRSPVSLAVSKFISEHPEATPEDITRFAAQYNRAQSAARTLGVRGANVDTAVEEAKGAARLALSTSDAVERTDYTMINNILADIRRGVSYPPQRQFEFANASLITAYAQTMSRTGANTVTAQNRAAEVLSTADGPAAYKAGIETLLQEMAIVQMAVREVEEQQIGGRPGVPAKSDPYKLR